MTDWSYFRTYYEICKQNFQTVETCCIAIDWDTNIEFRSHTPERLKYNFHLENGCTVCIYADTADVAMSISDKRELHKFVGKRLTYVYIPRPVFDGEGYVLLSITDGKKTILHHEDVVSAYRKTISTALWTVGKSPCSEILPC